MAVGPVRRLADDERAELLAMARRAVEGYLREGRLPEESPSPGVLTDPGAGFVTIRAGEDLRGCIGYTEAAAPLYRTVQECAVSAATEDPRFPPVTLRELARLSFEISVLSPLFPIRPSEVEVGVHGLLIAKGGRRGLLLPQVPLEWGWGREEFLRHLCRKAGLPVDGWREGAELLAFTAEVFGEPESTVP